MFERTRAAVSRLRWVIQRRPVVDDLDAELQAHAELLVERYVASGIDSRQPDQRPRSGRCVRRHVRDPAAAESIGPDE